jgi:hypothetical protein
MTQAGAGRPPQGCPLISGRLHPYPIEKGDWFARGGAPSDACHGQSRFSFLRTIFGATLSFEFFRPVGLGWESAGFLAAGSVDKCWRIAVLRQ